MSVCTPCGPAGLHGVQTDISVLKCKILNTLIYSYPVTYFPYRKWPVYKGSDTATFSSIQHILWVLFFINVYMVLFLFDNVIYVFLLLWLCILIVCLCMTTLTEVFPCFFLSCKANARVKPVKTEHGPHSYQFLCCSMYFLCCSMYFCVVLCIVCFLSFSYCLCVYMCTELLTPGGYQIAVKCIISYHIISYHIISYHIISYHIILYNKHPVIHTTHSDW